jgi:predicted DNA-binding ribbon-helix-helix protein
LAGVSLIDAILDKAADALSRGLVSRSFYIGKRRTSARFDALTWSALLEIAKREGVTVNELCTAIAAAKPRRLSLTVAIRLGVLQHYVDATTEHGHMAAGHGKIARWW